MYIYIYRLLKNYFFYVRIIEHKFKFWAFRNFKEFAVNSFKNKQTLWAILFNIIYNTLTSFFKSYLLQDIYLYTYMLEPFLLFKAYLIHTAFWEDSTSLFILYVLPHIYLLTNIKKYKLRQFYFIDIIYISWHVWLHTWVAETRNWWWNEICSRNEVWCSNHCHILQRNI